MLVLSAQRGVAARATRAIERVAQTVSVGRSPERGGDGKRDDEAGGEGSLLDSVALHEPEANEEPGTGCERDRQQPR